MHTYPSGEDVQGATMNRQNSYYKMLEFIAIIQRLIVKLKFSDAMSKQQQKISVTFLFISILTVFEFWDLYVYF